MRQKEIVTFDHFSIYNRWIYECISRQSNWTLIGISTWWFGPNDFCYKLCLFGIDFQFWFKREFKDFEK